MGDQNTDHPGEKSGSPLHSDRTAHPGEKSGSPLHFGRTAGLRERRTRYARNSRTISGRLHDELVMMDLEQGKYFSLNPIATRIWDLLERDITLNELCVLLMEEYEVEEDQCLDEVSEHLEEMAGLGLVLTYLT